MELSNKYIKGFDGLRALSVLLVVANHAGSFELMPDNAFVRTRLWLLFSGETGVMVFFAISGFLITTLLLSEKRITGAISFRKFFIRRFLRLMPALILFLSVVVLLSFLEIIKINGIAFSASLFYLYNYLPQKFNVVELTHTWSLGVEEQFYLIWPLVISAFQLRKIKVLIAVVIFLSVVFAFIIPELEFNTGDKSIVLTEAFRPYRWLIPAVVPVMLGAFMALVLFRSKKMELFSSKLIFPVVILLFISPVFLPAVILPLHYFLQSTGVALLLAALYCNQETAIVRILEFRPIAFVGVISYGIYIWQGLFLRTGPGSELWFQQFPQNIVFTFCAALLSYFLIEKYFITLRKKIR